MIKFQKKLINIECLNSNLKDYNKKIMKNNYKFKIMKKKKI